MMGVSADTDPPCVRFPRASSTYLNNRYHDPTLGSFLSVDPLVHDTGQPYIYGAANPVTLSDPDGLCPISGSGSAEACWAFAAVSSAGHSMPDFLEDNPIPALPYEAGDTLQFSVKPEVTNDDECGEGAVTIHGAEFYYTR